MPAVEPMTDDEHARLTSPLCRAYRPTAAKRQPESDVTPLSLRLVLAAATFGSGVSILGNLFVHWLRTMVQRYRAISTQKEADRQKIRQALIRPLDGELAKLIIGAMIEAGLHEDLDPDAARSGQKFVSLVESGLWLERVGCPALYAALLILMLALNFRVAALVFVALISASLASTFVGIVRKHFGV